MISQIKHRIQNNKVIFFLTLVIVTLICTSAAVFLPSVTIGDTQASWTSLLPPLVAISMAFITADVLLSLGVGVIVGGFLASGDFVGGLITGPRYVFESATDSWNLQVLAFIIFILGMVSVTVISGGMRGIVNWLSQFAKTPRSTQFVTTLMGVIVFIDDYANTMIVGSAMRPVTDKHKISREKLAFLVDATSAPVVSLAVVSTWIGYEVSQFNKVSETMGLGLDGYVMFFDALSYRFYCYLLLIFILINIFFDIDFGPMATAQKRAAKKGQVQAPDAQEMTSMGFSQTDADPNARILALTAVVPLCMLFFFVFGGLWADGGGLELGFGAMLSFESWRNVLSNSENNVLVLACAGFLGMVMALITAMFTSKLAIARIFQSAWLGLKASSLPVMILILAWSLKASCDGVHTDTYLIGLLGDHVAPSTFPTLVFLLAGLTAFTTGTSYGTMAILIPTAVPLAYALDGNAYNLVTIVTLGAVLDGAILGDHCSPISDTTVMSSIASGCDHVHHVQTQLPYAVLVGVTSILLGYWPAAMGFSPLLGVLIGTGLFIGIFAFLKLRRTA